MQKTILFILGIFLIGIVPVFISALFQKRNNEFDREKTMLIHRNNLVYLITLFNLCIFFLLDKNTDILLGTFIGSSIFRLLAVGGVSQLFYRNRNKTNERGQYLAFCVILLLFLSADYLLTGNISNNILSRIDGGLLLFLFILYLLTHIHSNNFGIYFFSKSYYLYIISLEVSILPGAYLFTQNIPKIGAGFGFSQYLTGLTIVSWCVNISTMLLSKEKNEEVNYLEGMIEGTIISITFLLGGSICILPISISAYMIYDLILFGVISIVLQLIQKIDNRLAASSMATVYIAFIIYAFVR